MVNRKRRRETEETDVQRLCRTVGSMMRQMTDLQNQNALLSNAVAQHNITLQEAPEAVAPAPVSHYSVAQAPASHYSVSCAGPSNQGPSFEPSIPLGQGPHIPLDLQEDQEEEEEDRGYFLFQLAHKYGLAWAIKGEAPPAQSELGRPSAVSSFDKMLLTPGAGIDILSYINNHLKVPALDEVPVDFESVVLNAPRRATPLSASGYKPIPMARYSSVVAPMAALLDVNLAAPVGSFLPKPVFPGNLSTSRFMVLAALEGVTALNILHELPTSALPEDRVALCDHIGSIFYAIMRKSSEHVGTAIRMVRYNQLGGVTKATREELVHQPILGESLYTDDKKVGLAAQPPSRGRYFPRGARRGWTAPAAPTPSPGGFQPQGGHGQSFAHTSRRSRPPYTRPHRGGRGGRRGRR